MLEIYIKSYQKTLVKTPELFHYDYFKLKDGELYYRGSRKPLTTKGVLKSVGMIADILGKNRLRRLGFNIPVGKLTAQQAVMLNKAAEELLSESDITKVDDIELQEIVEKASGIISQIKDVQTDTEDLFEHPLRELLGVDKQLRSIRGSLKVEVAKKVELEEHITKEHGEPPPKDAKVLKGWVSNKLKALASLLGKLGMKAAEALPGIIGKIISWILNRAKHVVGWVSQNLWALVVDIGGLIYTYMVTRK